MEASLQPQLKRAERVSQGMGVAMLSAKRAALKSTAGKTMLRDGVNGVAIGLKFQGVRRNEFGGRGADCGSK